MEFFEAVRKRSSYRSTFAELPVPREDIIKILEAGIRAPSGLNF